MKVDFKVKEESIFKFFKDNSRHSVRTNDSFNEETVSVYNLLQDSLILDIGNFVNNEIVEITLSDRTKKSNKSIVNIYKYKVCKYDDVSCELKLVDFKIELK